MLIFQRILCTKKSKTPLNRIEESSTFVLR